MQAIYNDLVIFRGTGALSDGSENAMTDKQAKNEEMPEFVKRRRPARRAILEVARRLLVRDGSDALTPEAVAKESGLSLEIVYAYFCNKDELLLSIASDELSALNRKAKDGDKGDEKSTDEMGILELPKIVEGFIAARADSTPEEQDEESEDAESDEDEPAAQTKQQTPGKAPSAPKTQAASPEETPTPQPNTPPREVPRARRKSAPSSEIDGIVKELTVGEQSGEAGIPAMVARLERRLYVIERDLAEEAENGSEDDADDSADDPTDIEQLVTRIGALEKHLKGISKEIRTAQKTTSDRLRILEATPPAGPSFSEDVPGTVEPAIALVETAPSDDEDDPRSGKGDGEDKSLEAFLSAAREAAKSAVVDAENANSENNGSLLTRWKQKASATLQAAKSAFEKAEVSKPEAAEDSNSENVEVSKSENAEDSNSENDEASNSENNDSPIAVWKQKAREGYQYFAKLDRKTLLTRVVPIPVVLLGLAVTAWAAMNAGQNLESAPLDVSAVPAGTVTLLQTNIAPQSALSPRDALMAAAEAGDSDAQTMLGLNYLDGDGVAVDDAEAVRLLQLASENGQAVAQYNLATIYARSDSAVSDPIAAKFWFQSAAKQGNRMAMNNLAMFYAQGLGTEQDTTEAAHWFAMAAALGFEVAQYNLAVLYERGDGVQQDNAQAYKWYAIAGLQGDDDALGRATFLAENIDPDVLFDLQTEVAAFEPAATDPKINNPPQFDLQTG